MSVELVDRPNDVSVLVDGEKIAVAWGPAADNNQWFIAVPGREPRRVADRHTAVLILGNLRDEYLDDPGDDDGH